MNVSPIVREASEDIIVKLVKFILYIGIAALIIINFGAYIVENTSNLNLSPSLSVPFISVFIAIISVTILLFFFRRSYGG